MPALAPDHWLTDEEKVMLGQVPIVALHTPGHTPGSMSFHVPNDKLLLAGDTLFRGSIGRTDLWGGNFETIEESIRERLYTLDEATTVVTGHGPDTEIGLEKESNQFVRVYEQLLSGHTLFEALDSLVGGLLDKGHILGEMLLGVDLPFIATFLLIESKLGDDRSVFLVEFFPDLGTS